MEIAVFPSSDVYLKLVPVAENRSGYPTSHLQKGLVLIANGEELAEEGVGFGAPVVMLGLQTIFPGAVRLADWKEGREITAVFRLNLKERLTGHNQRLVRSQSLIQIKHRLEETYRRIPATRRWLALLSNGLRRGFGLQISYEYAGWDYPVSARYTFDRHTGNIMVEIDASELPQKDVTEVVVMNEQGAHHFDTYTDSSGTRLQGEAIGSWEEVTAERASFFSRHHRLAFSLPQIEAARLFRGRELVSSHLAWAGFGYSFSPIRQRIAYPLQIERLP